MLNKALWLRAAGDVPGIFPTTHLSARVTGEGHVFLGIRPLPDHEKRSLSARLVGIRWSSFRDAYRRSGLSLLRRSGHVPSAFWVTDKGFDNYWHWLFESVPKLWLIAKADPEALILLPHWLHDKGQALESLAALGLRNFQFVKPGSHVKVDRLTTLSKSPFHPDAIRAIRAEILAHIPAPASGPERVYVSRNDATKRRVVNEVELLPILRAKGFEVVEMAKLSFREQVQLMQNCRMLASMHGAGLTNMTFMPAGSHIVEFRTKNDCFVRLAETLGHKHHPVHGIKARPRSDHHADWIIDAESLHAGLRECELPQ